MHVRTKRKSQSKFVFLFDKQPVPYCANYLGATLNEYLDYNFTVGRLADSAGRALGAIIT